MVWMGCPERVDKDEYRRLHPGRVPRRVGYFIGGRERDDPRAATTVRRDVDGRAVDSTGAELTFDG